MDLKPYEVMAKLDLPQVERQDSAARAETLLQPLAEMEKVDTAAVQPLVTVLELQNVLREDNAQKFLTREELLENAPEQYDGYFQVPKTMD